MNVEDQAIVSDDTIRTLQTLVRQSEFSSRAVRVAALTSLNHPAAEQASFFVVCVEGIFQPNILCFRFFSRFSRIHRQQSNARRLCFA